MTKKEFLAGLMEKYPQISGVSFGTKIKDGKLTGEKSIKFRVDEKKSPHELNESEALPPYLEYGGDVYKTDVEGGKIHFHASSVFPQGARTSETASGTAVGTTAGGSTTFVVSGLTSTQVDQINASLTMKWGDPIPGVDAATGGFGANIASAVFNSPNTTINTVLGMPPITSGDTVTFRFKGTNGDGALNINGLAPGIPNIQNLLSTPDVIKCGGSIGSDADPGFLGTIGCIAQDIDNDNVVALTNAHVAAGIKYGHQYPQPYTNDPNALTTTAVGEAWHYPYNEITNHGTVYRVHQNNAQNNDFTDPENTIDAAVLFLGDNVWDADSYQMIQSAVLTSNPEWATTAELNALSGSATDIFMTGARTGIKGSDIDYVNGIKLRITAEDVNSQISVPAGSDILADFSSIAFNDLLQVQAVQSDGITTCAGVSQGGDSGSAVYADIGGNWKLIGLLFAGGYTAHTGLICRIDHIADKLRVKRWDGTTTSQAATTVDTIVLQGDRTEASVTHNGNIYYRVGLTGDDADTIVP